MCNGTDGIYSLVNIKKELPGMFCEFGGLQILTGNDSNRNNTLDSSEISKIEYVCNGANVPADKLISLKIFDMVSSPNGTSPTHISTYKEGYGGITKFNIQDYADIDSAVLIVFDVTIRDGYMGTKVPGTATIELYDCRNNKVVTNSAITASEIPDGSYLVSGNFFDQLPEEEVELGIKITKSGDFYLGTADILLVLFRRNQ
ncbi:MAG: hypothetical protein U0T82_10690 [Bacteroidales bacterium]